MGIAEARQNLRETGREHEEQEKLEKERLEEMHEPAPLSREEVFALSTGRRKQSVQRFHAQATPHVKDITGPLAPAEQDFQIECTEEKFHHQNRQFLNILSA